MNHRLTAVAAGLALAVTACVPTPASGTQYDVNTTSDTVDSSPGDGDCADVNGQCSLRAAFQEANATGGTATVALDAMTYALTIDGAGSDSAASGDLDVASSIVLLGNGATLDLSSMGDRGFDVAPGARLDARQFSVSGGTPPETESGGAFRSSGALALDRVTASDNHVVGAGASGGAIANLGGTLTVVDSVLSSNSAPRAGGAIEANAGMTEIVGTVLDSNLTGPMPGNGGAFHLTGAGAVVVDRSVVTNNTAAAEGGGLWNSAVGVMTVTNTHLAGNVANGTDADQGGGALFNDGGMMAVANSTLVNNRATEGSGSGGGIANIGGAVDVTNTRILDNQAARAGGGIETAGGKVTITAATVDGNVTGPMPGNGGGLHAGGAATVEVKRSTFRDNSATNEGGGLWNSAVGTMSLDQTSVLENHAEGVDADNGGGGIFNQGDGTSGGTLTVNRSEIAGNTATQGSGSGGGILNEQGTLNVSDTLIALNSANRAGGGIEGVGGSTESAGSTVLSRVRLLSNATGAAPGNGGAVHVTGNTTMQISRSVVRGNVASNEGGGLWNFPTSEMTVTDTPVAGNTVGVEDNGMNVFQKGPVDGGVLSVDGGIIAEGPNALSYP